MKTSLERLMFMAVLTALALGGWLALDGARIDAGPVLVSEAAVAPAVIAPVNVAPAAAPPAPEVPPLELDEPSVSSPIRESVTAPAEPTAAFLQAARTAAPAEPVAVEPVAAPSAAQETVAAEVEAADTVAAAPVSEQLAPTAPDDEAPIVVEHTIASIPDPPDVGSSERRETFEVDAEADAYDPWLGVRRCESHNNYAINTGNGFFGAYQFTTSTWDWVAGLIGRPDLIGVRPDLAAPWDQDRLAQALAFEVDGGGLHHWPVCGRYYG